MYCDIACKLNHARSGYAKALAVSWVLATLPAVARADNIWGGSIGVSSDYFVRGVSRSAHEGALQGDVHFATNAGFIGGLFVSTTKFQSDDSRDVELDPFVGFAWTAGPWRNRMTVAHYTYPWNSAGSGYDYDELSVDLTYRGWLNFNAMVSPNAFRYIPYRGLIGVNAAAAEVNLLWDLHNHWAAAAGLGAEHLAGPDPGTYLYWSAALSYEFAPMTLSVAYVNTDHEAKYLFYDAAARNHWTVTAIWRF